uniref:DUF4232 domain-containing protein n=1 Tax=Nonomuraea lactucae TaxID=2249762 RepID=UPI0013B36482
APALARGPAPDGASVLGRLAPDGASVLGRLGPDGGSLLGRLAPDGGSVLGGCAPAQLDVGLGRVDPGAGSRYVPLVFTNRSGAGCVMRGHPGLVMLDDAGAALPGTAEAVEGPGEAVTLEPGGSVEAVLHWTVTADHCAGAARLRVTPPPGAAGQGATAPSGAVEQEVTPPVEQELTPPGERAATTIAFPADRVCGALEVTPVRQPSSVAVTTSPGGGAPPGGGRWW